MLAGCVVIDGEKHDSLLQFLQDHIDSLPTADGVEFDAIEKMASC
jgi:hypothetical protein